MPSDNDMHYGHLVGGVTSNRVAKKQVMITTGSIHASRRTTKPILRFVATEIVSFLPWLCFTISGEDVFCHQDWFKLQQRSKTLVKRWYFLKTLVWNPEKFGLSWSNLVCSYLCWVVQPPPSLWLFYRKRVVYYQAMRDVFSTMKKGPYFKIKKQ